MKTAAMVIGLALALVAAPTLAWDEPDSFLGIKWGDAPEAGQAAIKERNGRTDCKAGTYVGGPQTHCFAWLNLGTVPLSGNLRFTTEGFVWAFGGFPSNQYTALRAMFVEKYGEPTSTKEAELSNRVGGRFTNESLVWHGDKVIIRLSRYGSKITDGLFEVITRAEDDKRTERMKALQQKGKGAL